MRPRVVVAAAPEKRTAPKSASGSAWQLLEVVQSDGASAIHSADIVSTALAATVRPKD